MDGKTLVPLRSAFAVSARDIVGTTQRMQHEVRQPWFPAIKLRMLSLQNVASPFLISCLFLINCNT